MKLRDLLSWQEITYAIHHDVIQKQTKINYIPHKITWQCDKSLGACSEPGCRKYILSTSAS